LNLLFLWRKEKVTKRNMARMLLAGFFVVPTLTYVQCYDNSDVQNAANTSAPFFISYTFEVMCYNLKKILAGVANGRKKFEQISFTYTAS